MKLNIYVNQYELRALQDRAEQIHALTHIKPTVAKIIQQQVATDSSDITPVCLIPPRHNDRCISIRLSEPDASRLLQSANKNAMSLNKYIRTKINNLFIGQ